MVILEDNKIIPVYCYYESKSSVYGYTEICETTIIENIVTDGEIPMVEEGVFKGEKWKFYSSIPEVTYELYTAMISIEYMGEEDKKKYEPLIANVRANAKQNSLIVLQDYYEYKIKNGEFELWKNDFDDRVMHIAESEYYIDDEKFDIFYNFDNDGNYLFNFFIK